MLEIEQSPNLTEFWSSICFEARYVAKQEPRLEQVLNSFLLNHLNLSSCLAFLVANKLKNEHFPENLLLEISETAYGNDIGLTKSGWKDILATFERDPACTRLMNPVLYFKGFQALQCYRVSHFFYNRGDIDLALNLQVLISDRFSVDIHPRARLGSGLLIDHAHGIVIGETAKVGNNVSILHAVTLGGTGKETGNRHPKIEDGVLIGAGAKVLGNITVGECSKIAAGSVVLTDVPNRTTVAGVPAKVVGKVPIKIAPSKVMDHKI